ncbi:zinc finger protein 354B isoform X11 [Monodelphis domestica]|uniref:zinc finger protein 354B isoform X11 n=1 Tax=Monodelphis domestica TaxID=13616 RepID=UPI0024E1DB4E|nr:zinc finger protein 354B isoform X11 [Monodelphis domestica]
MAPRARTPQGSLTFRDVAVDFTWEQWGQLQPSQKELYREDLPFPSRRWSVSWNEGKRFGCRRRKPQPAAVQPPLYGPWPEPPVHSGLPSCPGCRALHSASRLAVGGSQFSVGGGSVVFGTFSFTSCRFLLAVQDKGPCWPSRPPLRGALSLGGRAGFRGKWGGC